MDSLKISKHLTSVSPSKKNLRSTQSPIREENEDEILIPTPSKHQRMKVSKKYSNKIGDTKKQMSLATSSPSGSSLNERRRFDNRRYINQ